MWCADISDGLIAQIHPDINKPSSKMRRDNDPPPNTSFEKPKLTKSSLFVFLEDSDVQVVLIEKGKNPEVFTFNLSETQLDLKPAGIQFMGISQGNLILATWHKIYFTDLMEILKLKLE